MSAIWIHVLLKKKVGEKIEFEHLYLQHRPPFSRPVTPAPGHEGKEYGCPWRRSWPEQWAGERPCSLQWGETGRRGWRKSRCTAGHDTWKECLQNDKVIHMNFILKSHYIHSLSGFEEFHIIVIHCYGIFITDRMKFYHVKFIKLVNNSQATVLYIYCNPMGISEVLGLSGILYYEIRSISFRLHNCQSVTALLYTDYTGEIYCIVAY